MEGAPAAATVARLDASLRKLHLPANADLAEGSAFTAEERDVYARVAKKVPQATLDSFDKAWTDRLVRGLWTHNKGTPDERFAETVDAFERISAWRRDEAVDTILERRLKGAETVMDHIRVTAGGSDLYGHVVWVEQLVDVAKLCHCGLETEEILAVRAQATEAMESLKVRIAQELGLTRYKQVYVLDLSVLALGPLIRRGDVRKLTGEIMGLGSKYYPEGMWRIYIINAPLIFRTVYSIISPMINPVTRDKINILGGPKAFLERMAKHGVPQNAVPKLVGGTHPGLEMKAVIEERLRTVAAASKAAATPPPTAEATTEPAPVAAAATSSSSSRQAPPPETAAQPPRPQAVERPAPVRRPPTTSPSAPQPPPQTSSSSSPQAKSGGPWLCCGAGAVAQAAAPEPRAAREAPRPNPEEEEGEGEDDAGPPAPATTGREAPVVDGVTAAAATDVAPQNGKPADASSLAEPQPEEDDDDDAPKEDDAPAEPDEAKPHKEEATPSARGLSALPTAVVRGDAGAPDASDEAATTPASSTRPIAAVAASVGAGAAALAIWFVTNT